MDLSEFRMTNLQILSLTHRNAFDGFKVFGLVKALFVLIYQKLFSDDSFLELLIRVKQ